jgi:hypothetical protein
VLLPRFNERVTPNTSTQTLRPLYFLTDRLIIDGVTRLRNCQAGYGRDRGLELAAW